MSVSTETGGNSVTVSGGTDAGAASAPATFAAADWTSDASPASESPDPSTDAAPAVQATTDPGSPQQTDDRSPFIPRARFDEVNTKKGELESKLAALAWADGVDQGEFTNIRRIASAFSGGDFMAGLNALITEGRKDPAIEAQIRSFAARTLAQRAQQPPAEDVEPQFMVPQPDGSVAFDPAAHAQWKQWNERRLIAQLEQKFAPVIQTHQQLQQERAAAQEAAQWNSWQMQMVSDTNSWPGMTSPDGKPTEIRAQFAAEVGRQIMGRDVTREQIERAIDKAYRTIVVPTLSRQAEARQLDTLQKQAAASTGINPGSAAATSQRRITKFSDLGPEAWR